MNDQFPSVTNDTLLICKSRVRAAAADRLAVRLQTERALQAASLHPVSLPHESILIVRHITARRTGRPGWEQPVRSRLDQLAREASRPIDRPVPANANAVIFRDRSEFLACLAADWYVGDLNTHWWWQGLLFYADVDRTVVMAWLETPEYIPMALQWLEVKHLSVSFIRKLSDAGAHQMIGQLVQTYGLYELLAFINQDTTSHSVVKLSAEQSLRTKLIGEISNAGSPVSAPWQRWIQDSSADRLSADRQFLLGIGLMLQRAPSMVRTASFARQVKDWQSSFDYFRSGARTSQRQISIQPTGELSSASTRLAEATPESMSPRPGDQIPETKENVSVNQADFVSSESSVEITTGPPLMVSTASNSTIDRGTSMAKENIPRPDIQVKTTEKSVDVIEIEIRSQFGGICYFINLGVYLDLYGDFTTPLQPGIDLPIWDFVALLGHQIIGDEIMRDPIWSLLAQLAGRAEDEPPGAHFDPPRHESFQAWLDELIRIVRPRLQLALGKGDEELPHLFTQPARIRVTATRLDAYFSLDGLPIEIRLSGLDRDPGWVPAAGKFIGFHYE